MVSGSLTWHGQQFSLDLKLFESATGKAPSLFTSEGRGIENLPSTVEKLAQSLGSKIFKRKQVLTVDVTGNQRIEVDAIKRVVKSQPGDIYNLKSLSEDLKAIYAMGYFDDIQVEVEALPDGNKVTFKVKEKPTLRSVRISGNKWVFDSDEIREVVTAKRGSILNVNVIQNDMSRIEDLYKEKNYHNVSVDYKIFERKDNQADLEFVIEEGDKFQIEKIVFEGNKAFSDKKLKRQMSTSETSLLSWISEAGDLDEDNLEQDVARLKAFYHNSGYIEAQVGEPQVEFKENDIFITIKIDEGPPFKVGKVTFAGDFFYRRDMGFDWVWDELYINGVRWRGSPPELPIIQPEKAAALPFEIHFTKEYAYTLRKTDVVEDRDCWVVDFEPVGEVEADNLYRGTVWIDRELFARVKTRAIQLGLEGDVISNEETVYFKPLDAAGLPAPWQAQSFFVPLRTVGQEVQSLLNATFPVERETVLQSVTINGAAFDDRLASAHASDSTMVRDTDAGMRYLEQEEGGTRVVKESLDFDSLSLVGGVFYEETRDYPLPLAGINYFSRDFRGSGRQINVFFAGVMINANIAEPSIFGSRWDAGGRLFALVVPGEEVLYRDGVEAKNESVETRPARAALFLGRPLGNFTKLSFTYGLDHHAFGRGDDTAEAFVVPKDTFTHSLGAELSYSRAGYSFEAEATGNSRSDWNFWGLPDSGEYDQEQEDFLRWQLSVAKAWYFKSFMKLALAAEHLDGSDLDRFSKYDFSPFSGTRVGGYQSGLVTASEANGLHLGYGFNMAEMMRVELRGDAMWASDEATGLDDEFLAGLSLNGTVMGPWETIINFDIGVPVEGPADGFTASIAFLKLWD